MKKKKIFLILVVLILLVIVVFTADYSIRKTAENKTFFEVEKIGTNKVGLVLGTSKSLKNGSINLYFEYRIDATVELYENGKIDFILVSGDNANKSYDEPTDFKTELISRGIPAEKIFLDYAGFRTLDSVVRAKEVFGQQSITIISQKFHNERAIYLANNIGLNAIGYNATDLKGRYGIKTKIREYLARTKAHLDVLFNVSPKFLGDKIEIK